MICGLQVNKNGQAVQQGIELFPFNLQGYLSLFALGGIADGAQQQIGVSSIFKKIILGSLPDRGEAQGFIGQAGQDHEGHLGGLGMSLDEGVQPLAVRQAQIQQYQVDPSLAQAFQPIGKPGHPLDGKTLPPGVGQHFPNQAGVARIIFNQQDLHGRIGHLHYLGGSMTTVNQKFSMDFTTSRNWSRSTGLVI